jgi:polysaccharide biosynthesis/export protein VpsN
MAGHVHRYGMPVAALLFLSAAANAGAQDSASAARRAAAAPVRSGDRVAVRFLRERELSAEVTVDERGEATFPKLGSLHVTRYTIAELQDTLRARYAQYLRLPELEVAVLRRIIVNGEVRVPNVYLVDGSATVRDAIALAGGITETGSRSKVFVMRDGIRIRVKDWDRDQGPTTDLRSGDQVMVGRKSWLVLNALSVISTAVLVSSFVISQVKQ